MGQGSRETDNLVEARRDWERGEFKQAGFGGFFFFFFFFGSRLIFLSVLRNFPAMKVSCYFGEVPDRPGKTKPSLGRVVMCSPVARLLCQHTHTHTHTDIQLLQTDIDPQHCWD